MLRERVEKFIAHGSDTEGIHDLLSTCMEDGSLDALTSVRRLFEDMYSDITFNVELKAPAGWTLVLWGSNGLDQLVEATLQCPRSKNVSLCVQILCAVATRTPDAQRLAFCDDSLASNVRSRCRTDSALPRYARRKLIELVLAFKDDEELHASISTGFLMLGMQGPEAAKELFAALSVRWLAISLPLLNQYETLIVERPNEEPPFQRFFTDHPQILDPMAAELWPQPDLFGAKRPDFVLRRFDNTYLVVEIETPAKRLVTMGNTIASTATHAIAQATDYRTYIRRQPRLQEHFPGLDDISCLVVVGLERELNDSQRQALRNDNLQRHALRTVGFDWLANRARSVQENLIRRDVRVRQARIT